MKAKLYILSILMFSSLLSCKRQDDIIGQQDIPLNLALKLKIDNENIINPTKSNLDENVIKDVNIWVFDGLNNLLNNYYIADVASSPFEIRITSGQRNLVFVVNYGSQINGVSTIAAIDALVYSNSTPVLMVNTPMVKKTGLITIPAPSVVGGTVTLSPIELTRLTSKITFTFDKSGLNTGILIKPIKIVLRQVPQSTPLFVDNSPSSTAEIIARGDSLEVLNEIISTDHNTAAPLFMLENQQGTTTNSDPKAKTPLAGKSNYTSFFEITANYSSPIKSGVIVYRFYLGGNTTNDFNMIRNNWYQISVRFKGQGGVNENTWRVDIAGLKNRFMPSSYVMPYMSGRSNYFIVPPTWATNIATISGDNPVSFMYDSVRMVQLKKDNLNSSNEDVGSFYGTSPTKEYKVKSAGYGKNDAFIDVSTLLFPKNARFGSKNYYITQYVNVFNVTNQTTWKAISSSDWIYIGNGASVQSFSSTGVATNTAYAGMKNLSMSELNSSEITNNAVAVRCTENTSTSIRRGQIVFIDENDNEFARVYISQNPSTYPTSPVHLTYIPAGIIKAGAFKSDGAIPSVLPLLSSVLNIYSFISPFYLATKETTSLQFADFLNDLGATSSNDLKAVANVILDKSGVIITDYKGAVDVSITIPFNTTSGMVQYSLGMWIASKKQFYRSANTLASVSATVDNYPINEVGFYTASDYNYWAMKYAGKSPDRLSTPLLVSELEWEVAARGIVNQQTTLASWLASTDINKNGDYPYAMPRSSLYNNGLNGSETGIVSVLRTFAWYDNGSLVWPKSSGGLGNYYIHPSGNLFPNGVGLYDMNGNVGEWVFDNYNGLLNLSFLPEFRNENVVFYGSLIGRVIRGGGAYFNAGTNSNVARSSAMPNELSKYVGFRTVIR